MVPTKSTQTASRIIDNQAVIIVLNQQKSLILNSTGSRIWELIDGKRNVEEIASLISKEFACRVETALADVEEFLKDLSREKAIEWRNEY